MDNFPIRNYHTDNWGSYSKYLPSDTHIISKKLTQNVERINLTLRNAIKRLNRKTIGFSKSETIHDKVIGSFINEFLF